VLSQQGSQDTSWVEVMHSFKAAHELGEAWYGRGKKPSHTREHRSSKAAKSEFRRCNGNNLRVVHAEGVK
jgi:hypothetical protein